MGGVQRELEMGPYGNKGIQIGYFLPDCLSRTHCILGLIGYKERMIIGSSHLGLFMPFSSNIFTSNKSAAEISICDVDKEKIGMIMVFVLRCLFGFIMLLI